MMTAKKQNLHPTALREQSSASAVAWFKNPELSMRQVSGEISATRTQMELGVLKIGVEES